MHMTDEERDYYERTRKPLIPTPRTPLGKALLGVVLTVWFMLMLLPCALIYLATSGNITLHHASIPEPESHPWLRIQLIMEPDNRGLQFTRSSSQNVDDELCVETTVNFFFWQTTEENTAAIFCDCYSGVKPDWQLSTTAMQPCTID